MATPTITSVDPSVLWTGGQMFRIVGTNFRLPSAPGASSGPLPKPIPSVSVSIGAEASTRVDVLSATELFVYAPEHDPGAVALVVQNLDDAGDPIPGESATAPNLLSYARPDLTASADSTRIDEALILSMRRQIIENVVTFVDADYSEEPYEQVYYGKVPALVISGPTLRKPVNPVNSVAIYTDGYPSLEFTEWRPAVVSDLVYEVMGLADNGRQLRNLQALVAQYFDRNIRIKILRDVDQPQLGYTLHDMELDWGADVRATTTPNKSNLHSFTGGFVIHDFGLESIAGFPKESRTNIGGVVQTITVTTSKIVV